MKFIDKIRRLPYRLNRQSFNGDNSCLERCKTIVSLEEYFSPMSNQRRIELSEIIEKGGEKEKPIEGKIIAHTYWYGQLGRKQVFSLLSYLCTQDLNNTEVWLWLDAENGYEGYEKNEYLQPLLPYITVKAYDPEKELQGIRCLNKSLFTQKHNLPYRADAFRLLMLYKYGGLYFDMDIMFLKDLKYLYRRGEFCYAWERQAYANNALLYFKSYNAGGNIEKIFRKACRKAPMPWVVFRYDDSNMRDITVYPVQLFDSAWLPNATSEIEHFEDFFKEFGADFHKSEQISSYRDFFQGAYTYHWHNQWKLSEVCNSYFGMFEKEMKREAARKLGIKEYMSAK